MFHDVLGRGHVAFPVLVCRTDVAFLTSDGRGTLRLHTNCFKLKETDLIWLSGKNVS